MVSVQLHGSKKPSTIVTPLGTDALPGLPTASAAGTGSGKHIHLDREVGSCSPATGIEEAPSFYFLRV